MINHFYSMNPTASGSLIANSLFQNKANFTCLEACQLLYEQAPQFFDFVAGCITNATTCEEVQACVPLGR